MSRVSLCRTTVGQRSRITAADKERIYQLAQQGITPQQIAARLGVSVTTARNYSKNT
ncbi:MAG: helix-turn-helix domain-containing protein [Synechococcaceae cyanobacterium SM2_3_2]|nr:helix-turn-helix domain-containing protein [Synechococcaceae cyanobacterium SM2_3_2]